MSAFGHVFNAFVMRIVQSLALPWGPADGANGGGADFLAINTANSVGTVGGLTPFQVCVLVFSQDAYYKFTTGGAPVDPVTAAEARATGWRRLPKGVYRRVTPPGCTMVAAVGVSAAGNMDVQRLPTEVGETGAW